MNLQALEQQFESTLQSLAKQDLEVPIYKARKSTEVDMQFYAVHPKDSDYLLCMGETLAKVMKFCESRGLRYKYLPNSGTNFV